MKPLKQDSIEVFSLPVHSDARGSLAVSEFKDLPFTPKRAYFLYDTQTLRGGHAHLKEQEVFVCVAGSFRARVHDGKKWKTIAMNKPGKALYTAAMIWHEFDSFSNDAIMLALTSTPYTGTKEYILDLESFKNLKK